MQKLLWLLPLSIILYACPYESMVPLEKNPAEPIDSTLIGYWYGIIKDGSDYFGIEALEISRQSDSVYSIIRYGKAVKGDMILPDTSYFTAYTSWIGDQRFMNVKGTITLTEPIGKKNTKTTEKNVFYLSAFEKSNDTLRVKTITESFTTRKIINQPGDLKKLVIEMSGKKNIYDEQYSLSYRKIPKTPHFQSN